MNLKTCLKKVDMLITKLGLEGYEIKRESFKFRTKGKDPALEMILTQPQHGQIGVKGKKKVWLCCFTFLLLTSYFTGIDIPKWCGLLCKTQLSEEELECLQSDEFYPPRFEVFFASVQENATLSDGKIAFRGATTDIEFNVHLDLPSPITPTSSLPVPVPKVSSRSTQQHFGLWGTYRMTKRFIVCSGGLSDYIWCPTFDELLYVVICFILVSDTEHQLVDPKRPLSKWFVSMPSKI